MRKKKVKTVPRSNTSTKKVRVYKKKAAVAKKARKGTAPKVRNAGTMSESAFWSFIRSALRNKTRFWKPRLIVLNKAKRPYKGTNKRQKFEYQCAHCKEWWIQRMVEVNHKVAAGRLKCAADLPQFVTNLFCEADGLEVVCKSCHAKHHEKEKEKEEEK